MPLEWTHEKCRKSSCDGTTNCAGFPTIKDRIHMAHAAYEEYAESDGTPVIDFALDVLLLRNRSMQRTGRSSSGSPNKLAGSGVRTLDGITPSVEFVRTNTQDRPS